MPEYKDIDFGTADHRQRKMLRQTLLKLFRERSLVMYLDEELNFFLRDEVKDGPLKEQVYELIIVLKARGRLNELMQLLCGSTEYSQSPDLNKLVIAWNAASVGTGKKERSRKARAKEPVERILDGKVSRMAPMKWISGIAAIRRRVCRLRVGKNIYGTGFLVGPDMILTAGYLLASKEGQGSCTAVFDIGIGSDGTPEKGRTVEVGRQVVRNSSDIPKSGDEYLQSLDYALLPLSESVGLDPLEDATIRGWFDLTKPRERLREGETVFLLHHPEAGPMSLSEGKITQEPGYEHRFGHSCDTSIGSGGAPVVDAMLRLIGLHEVRFSGTNGPSMAVRADQIADHLAEQGVKITGLP